MTRRSVRRRAAERTTPQSAPLARTTRAPLPGGDALNAAVSILLGDSLWTTLGAVLTLISAVHDGDPDKVPLAIKRLQGASGDAWRGLYVEARGKDTRPLHQLTTDERMALLRHATAILGRVSGVTGPAEPEGSRP